MVVCRTTLDNWLGKVESVQRVSVRDLSESAESPVVLAPARAEQPHHRRLGRRLHISRGGGHERKSREARGICCARPIRLKHAGQIGSTAGTSSVNAKRRSLMTSPSLKPEPHEAHNMPKGYRSKLKVRDTCLL